MLHYNSKIKKSSFKHCPIVLDDQGYIYIIRAWEFLSYQSTTTQQNCCCEGILWAVVRHCDTAGDIKPAHTWRFIPSIKIAFTFKNQLHDSYFFHPHFKSSFYPCCKRVMSP